MNSSNWLKVANAPNAATCPDCGSNDLSDYSALAFDGESVAVEYECNCGGAWSEQYRLERTFKRIAAKG
jgi:hypothetical protein